MVRISLRHFLLPCHGISQIQFVFPILENDLRIFPQKTWVVKIRIIDKLQLVSMDELYAKFLFILEIGLCLYIYFSLFSWYFTYSNYFVSFYYGLIWRKWYLQTWPAWRMLCRCLIKINIRYFLSLIYGLVPRRFTILIRTPFVPQSPQT